MEFSYNPANNKMLLDKCPIGTIIRKSDGGYHVTDVRGRSKIYWSFDDATSHFHNFGGWKEYTRHGPKPKNRTVYADKEVRKRFANT